METDHEQLHRDLEGQREEMQERRDSLDDDTDTVRQDVTSKVSDERVPGLQDEQEDVIHGRKEVERRQQSEEDESSSEEGGGSEGAGYREGGE